MSRHLLMVVLTAAAILGAATAQADQAKCRKTLGKAIAKYAKLRFKAIAKCEDQRAAGTLSVGTTCREQCAGGANAGAPCASNADCDSNACGTVSDATTSAKLAAAVTKFDAMVDPKCTLPLPPVGPACDGSTGSVAALKSCVTQPRQESDSEQTNVDTLAVTVYDTAAPLDASLVKCQAAISKEAGKYVDKRIKAALKCNEAVAKGKSPGPCPDAITATTYEAVRVKLDTGIRKKCTEAQLASDVVPKLDFGFPCEKYKLVTFKRDTPLTSGNTIPVLDRFIGCMTDAGAAVADRYVSVAYPGEETSAFTQGVAAGDATDSAVIFWTRLPDSTQGAFLDVATDSGFTTALQTIAVSSAGGDDGTVKQEVTLLAANTTYFYRFRQGSNTSATGRVKTLPTASTTATVRVGWTGDANAFFRPYTVLDPMRLQNPDAWFFIGDTIYGDDPRSGTGIAAVLPDYYGKYKENRQDAALRNVMASTGTYVMWDDHETRNDVAGDVAAFAAKMAAGNRAFRRYNPIRENGGDDEQLYRSVRWGTLAEFFLIDVRQYRSAKYTCCNIPAESGYVLTDSDTTCSTGDLALPDATCSAALATPGRTVLGSAQKTWLKSALLSSPVTFKFVINGPPVTNLYFQPYDFWIGYPQERDEILGYILDPNGDLDQSDRIKNVIWLSTDLHGIVVSHDRVSIGPSQPIPEVVGGAVGMDSIFRELPPSIAGLVGTLPALLTQITEFDIDRFNSGILTVADGVPATATVDFYDRSGMVIHSIAFDAVP